MALPPYEDIALGTLGRFADSSQSPRTSKGYAAVSRARASAVLVFDKSGRRHPSVTAVCISYCSVNVGSKP